MLDASIYQNQAQQKSFADAMMPWAQLAQAKQNIEQSQAATAILQAQKQGIVAESALQAKKAAGQAWLTENSPKFKREDGSFDMSGLVNDAKAAGHIQLAQDIALNDAKQLSDYATAKINEAKATYAPQTAKADADKATADALTATTQAVAQTWGHMSTFLKGLPAEQQAQAYMAQREALMRTNPTVFNNATLPEYNGKNMKEIQSALEKGSMTPEVQKNLELGFGTLGVSQKNAETSRIATVAPIIEKGVEAKGAAQIYQNGVSALESMGISPTMAGTKIQQLIDTYGTQDPRVQQAQAAIDQYNADNPGANLKLTDGPRAFAVLKQAGKIKEAKGKVAETAGAPKTPEPTKVPVKGMVKMVEKGGDPNVVFEVPESKVKEAESKGLIRR